MMNCLRFVILAVLFTCLAVPAVADTVWPAPNGEFLYQGQLSYEVPRIAADANGTSLVVWGDESDGNRDVRAQLIDANQNILWPENGIKLVELEEFQDAVAVISVQDGWIMLWLDRRFYQDELDWGPQYNLDLFIQKYNYDGEPQWHDEEQPPANGIHVVSGDFPSVDYEIQLLPDGDGGAYVVYVLYNPWELDAIPIAQHVLSDGSFAWTDYGVDLLGPEGDPLEFISDLCVFPADDGDGFMTAWIGRPTDSGRFVQAQRVYADGTIWDNDTAPVIGEPVDITLRDLNLCTDGSGGAFVIWSTYADGIRAQRVAADGILMWGSITGSLLSAAGELGDETWLVPSDDNTAIGFWRESTSYLPTAQRFGGETELQTQWGDGVALADHYDYIFAALPDGNGGAVAIAGDYTHSQFLVHLDANGNIVANQSFIPDDAYSMNYSMVPTEDDRAVFVSNYLYGRNTITYRSYDILNDVFETPDDGLSMNDGESGVVEQVAFTHVDGVPYWVWSDYRISPFGKTLVMQSLDPLTAEKMFGEWGMNLLPGYPFTNEGPITMYANDIKLTESSDNSLIVSAEVSTYGGDEIQGMLLQKVTPDGQILWGDQGVVFEPTGGHFYINEFITPTDDGGCITLFTYLNSEWWRRLGMQRFNADGEPQWSDGDYDFIPLSPDLQDLDEVFHAAEMLDDGSVVVLTKYDYYGDYYMNRVSADGEVMWAENLIIADTSHKDPAMMELDGNVLICWFGSPPGDHDGIIAGQLVSPNGNLLWGAAPIELLDIPDDEYGYDDLQLQPCGEQAFWLAFVTYSGTESKVYAQQFDLDGIPQLFPLTGVPLSNTVDGIELDPDCAQVLPDNSLYVAWIEYPQYTGMPVYRRITQTGNFPVQYTDGPLPLSVPRYGIYELNMGTDGDGGAYAYWRNWGEEILPDVPMAMMAQRLNDGFMGVSESSAGTPDTWTLHQAYPNPFNASTTIRVDLPQRTHLKAQVFDILGREVMTIADQPFSAGRHTLTVDAEGLASGMYFLRVNQPGGMTRMQKLVLLK